ncbi:MAG: hypothetical protein QOE92_2582 [Chloroflexota bacterium]|nr:hypothetical protein [Chloroflexota bacterium]
MSDGRGLVVSGSIAQDFVVSPACTLDGDLGGSATYAALAARHFGPVAVVGCVGADRATELRQVLDFADLERLSVTDAPTYTWRARRASAGADAETLERFAGGYEGYRPQPLDRAGPPSIVFLGSCDPDVQLAVAASAPPGSLLAVDTMDVFIEQQRREVERVVGRSVLLFATERELELLTGTRGVAAAATQALDAFGLRAVVIKRGAGGTILWTADQHRRLPAPAVEVVDPTGAGDTVAGAMLGRLAEIGGDAPLAAATLVEALQWGMVAAARAISAPGLRGSTATSRDDLAADIVEYSARIALSAFPRPGKAGQA